jgi:hypothetical protein
VPRTTCILADSAYVKFVTKLRTEAPHAVSYLACIPSRYRTTHLTNACEVLLPLNLIKRLKSSLLQQRVATRAMETTKLSRTFYFCMRFIEEKVSSSADRSIK